MKKHYKSKIAAIAVGAAIKVLTGVVCGAVVLTGTYGVVKHTVLPNSTAKTQSMFAYEGEAGTGGTGGSAADSPVYQTELKRNGVIPAGGVYTLANGTQLTEGDDFPDTLTEGDTYTEGDYIYTYGISGDGYDIGNAWSVSVRNSNNTEYGEIISEIAGSSITDMCYAFSMCESLTTAPIIPNSVTNLKDAFSFCYALITAPTIPNSVTNMESTFQDCTSLTTAPTIPNSVTDMAGIFRDCSSLTVAPAIPNGVTDMSYTFYGCSSLKTYIGSTDSDGDFSHYVIPSGVTDMNYTFYHCTSLTTAPTIPDSVTYMRDTFSDCTSLTAAPVIPNSVTDMNCTFYHCTSLTGIIEINANINTSNSWYYSSCFKNTVNPITLTGSSSALSILAGTANNGNVTVG